MAEYNKGKRSDRQIHDYLEYVSESKKNDVAAEVIIQTGDMEFWSGKSPEQWEAMKPLLKEQLREARVRADQHNEQQIPKPHRTDLGMER